MEYFVLFFDSLKASLAPHLDVIQSVSSPVAAPISNFATEAAAALGQEDDLFRFIACLILSIPTVLLMRWIPSTFLRHVFSTTIGLFFAFFCYGLTTLHSVFVGLVCWLMMAALPKRVQHKAIFIFSFGYLTLCHLYRYIYHYLGDEIDFSGMHMMVTLKVISCAFNLADGARTFKDETCHSFRKRLLHVPSPLEYFSFLFFPASHMTGPVFDYVDFSDFMDRSFLKKNGLKALPFVGSRLLKNFGMVCLTISLYAVNMFWIPYTHLVTEAFVARPLSERLALTWLLPVFFKARYYFVWYWAQMTLDFAGFGISDVDKTGKSVWAPIVHADFFGVEFATTPRDTIGRWNIATSRFLRYYVYERIGNGKSTIGMYLTLVVSAIWHGPIMYVGFYIFFCTAAVYTEICRMIRSNIRKYFITDPPRAGTAVDASAAPQKKKPAYLRIIYNTLGFLLSSFASNSLGHAFVGLEWGRIRRSYDSIFWIGQIGTLVIFVSLKVFIAMSRSGRKKPTADAAAAAKKIE